jgi:hypothetical protein
MVSLLFCSNVFTNVVFPQAETQNGFLYVLKKGRNDCVLQRKICLNNSIKTAPFHKLQNELNKNKNQFKMYGEKDNNSCRTGNHHGKRM